MTLIEEYLHQMEILCVDKYSCENCVREHNKAADRCRKIATQIEQEHPELKSEFENLLQSDDRQLRLWVAHHMLEVMEYPSEARRRALKEIRREIRQDSSIQSMGNKMWLKEWYANHPKDRFL